MALEPRRHRDTTDNKPNVIRNHGFYQELPNQRFARRTSEISVNTGVKGYCLSHRNFIEYGRNME
jgi:hypothetical protein